MRIIDKRGRFDYYDGVQAYGVDTDLRYVRLVRNYLAKDAPIRAGEICRRARPPHPRVFPWVSELDLLEPTVPRCSEVVIGFCGRLYYGLRIKGRVCYTAEDVPRAIRQWANEEAERRAVGWRRVQAGIKDQLWTFERKPASLPAHAVREGRDTRPWCRELMEAELPGCQGVEIGSEPFAALDTPVFSIFRVSCGSGASADLRLAIPPVGAYVVQANPRLAALDFQRQVPASTAYQEIAMYVGGVLPKRGPAVQEISDAIMRDEKGFDAQSFKNVSPGERKARRRENKQRKREAQEKRGVQRGTP